MTDATVAIIGLPESGKTTFLAALWHLITARDIDTKLSFHTLSSGDASHLNKIAERWCDAKVQDRTAIGLNQLVSMNLRNLANNQVRITFPDISGETFRRMWEERDCDLEVLEILKAKSVLLFIHADTIRQPRWIVDEMALTRDTGLPTPNDVERPWHPGLAPTQVQITDILQLLRLPPLNIGPRRLAILLSAWDKAAGEGLSPNKYFEVKLPLLAQYLRSGADGWTYKVYGLSAQGGDYDPIDPTAPLKEDAKRLRKLNEASTRIELFGEVPKTHDLTEPIAWLMA